MFISSYLYVICMFTDVQSPNAVYEYAGDREMIDEEEEIRELEVKEKEQARSVWVIDIMCVHM